MSGLSQHELIEQNQLLGMQAEVIFKKKVSNVSISSHSKIILGVEGTVFHVLRNIEKGFFCCAFPL